MLGPGAGPLPLGTVPQLSPDSGNGRPAAAVGFTVGREKGLGGGSKSKGLAGGTEVCPRP